MKFRLPLIILGLVGALVVAVAVFLILRLGQGTAVELPVATADIAPGTQLDPSLFRLQEVKGLDTDAYITAGEFLQVIGYPVTEMVHAGFPVGKAQVKTDDPNLRQSRLTLLLDDPEHLVYPLAVSADEAGNYIVAGDYVDVIFTIGRIGATQIEHVEVITLPVSLTGTLPIEVTPTPAPRIGDLVTTTLDLPLSKVILPDLRVLRVEREQVRTASVSYGVGSSAQQPRQTTVEGDIVRLYVELDRAQAEILSFAVNNGTLNLPARAQPAGGVSAGYTWNDFVEQFFADRSAEEQR